MDNVIDKMGCCDEILEKEQVALELMDELFPEGNVQILNKKTDLDLFFFFY